LAAGALGAADRSHNGHLDPGYTTIMSGYEDRKRTALAAMGFGDFLKNIFGAPKATPADIRQLSAASEGALAASLAKLAVDEKGWITLEDPIDQPIDLAA
jgi:hypothetical protein